MINLVHYKLKRPFFLSNFFTRISNLRLGEWRFLLVLVQRIAIARHKVTFFFFLLTSSSFFLFGTYFLQNFLIRDIVFSQEAAFLIDTMNVSKKLFMFLEIPFFLKGINHLVFFDYISENWTPLFDFLSQDNLENICVLEPFDLIGIFNFIFPFNSESLMLCFDLNFFRSFILRRFYIFFFFLVFFILNLIFLFNVLFLFNFSYYLSGVISIF